MNSWKAEKTQSLLSEIKSRFSNCYTVKDLRWTIEHNRCWVNDEVERFASRKLCRGDKISIFPQKRPRFVCEKERILFEDDDLFVYNKPPLISSEALSELIGLPLVHRLDRDTSGVLLFPKNHRTKQTLEDLFRKRKIEKEYLAVVEGFPQKEGEIVKPVKGKWAKTEWKRLAIKGKRALLQCKPITGRTHQIRIHLKAIGHPIAGDYDYGTRRGNLKIFRPLLHAKRVKFDSKEFSAPVPEDLAFYI